MNTFTYRAKVTGTDGKDRLVYRVMAVEVDTIQEAAPLAQAADPQYFKSLIETVRKDVLIKVGNTIYAKTHKGHGQKVHISRFRDRGGENQGPVCGSGTVNFGFKRELTPSMTNEKVTCSKCLKIIREIEAAK